MTGFAQVRRVGMVAGLALGNAPVMTTHAGANDFVMIQRCNEG